MNHLRVFIVVLQELIQFIAITLVYSLNSMCTKISLNGCCERELYTYPCMSLS